MIYGYALGILHYAVEILLYPVLIALAVTTLLVQWELGGAVAERCGSLARIANNRAAFTSYVQRRLERVDLLARCGPILGLMGTLIPLGPGLAAMSNGQLDQLATAITIAFDTTVIGLFVGLIGYLLGRVRRRWYEAAYYAHNFSNGTSQTDSDSAIQNRRDLPQTTADAVHE